MVFGHKHVLLLAAFITSSISIAAVDTPSIRLPDLPASPPTPIDASVTLSSGQWYLIDSDVPLLVDGIGIAGGAISITEKKGPLTVPAFVAVGRKPDVDDPEMVTVKGPYVYVVKPAVTGQVIIDVVPTTNRVDASGKPIPFTRADLVRRKIDCNVGPRPPDPNVDPDVKPKPKPPTGKLWGLVIIEETADAAASRGAFFTDPALAAYMKTKGLKQRVMDQNAVDRNGKTPADMKNYVEQAKGKPLPYVFAVTDKGEQLAAQSMPSFSAAEVLKLLQKFGGQ